MNHFPLADDHTELNTLLDKVFDALRCADVERTYKSLDFFRARLAMHIRAEHLHLFPAIIKAIETQAAENYSPAPSLTEALNAINALQSDHNFFMRELLAMIKLLRELRENKTKANFSKEISDVREIIVSVKRRLEDHNETEETKVYGWADALLGQAECAALGERMQREITNLPPRFSIGVNS
jgi:hypothetical protein